jgi:hypothetical protein
MLRFCYNFKGFGMKIRVLLMFLAFLAAVLGACSEGGNDDNGDSSGSNGNARSSSSGGSNAGGDPFAGWPFEDKSGENLTSSPSYSALGLTDVIEIKYSGSDVEVTNSHSEVSIEKSGANVVVKIPDETKKEYNLVLSGATTSGSLKVYGNVRKGLYLNGVSITNSSGPAINIQRSGRVTVHLVSGTENFLTDGPSYATPPNRPDGSGPEQAKGTFFSEGKLLFDGSGSLEVRGKYNHAIAVDNDVEVNNGKIIVSEAVNDGIHANDRIDIKGGFLKILSTGDAIQSEREETGRVMITGGKIAARTTGIKSHGIASESVVSIRENALIQISVSGNGSKGIRTRKGDNSPRGYVEFLGGKTSILTTGDRHVDTENEDESTASGIKVHMDALYIDGGELAIRSEGDKAKGINVDEDVEISKGNVRVEADDDGIRVRGNLKITGGTVYVESKKKGAIDVTGLKNITPGTLTEKNGGS